MLKTSATLSHLHIQANNKQGVASNNINNHERMTKTTWSTISQTAWCHPRFHLADLAMITAGRARLGTRMSNLYLQILKMIGQ